MTSRQGGSRTPSDIEEHCRTRLEVWLKTHGEGAITNWVFEPNGHTTAPDFIVTINGREFAVEVAAAMAYEQAGDRLLSDSDVWNGLYSLLKTAERECRDEGILEGAYRVSFERAVPNLGRVQHALRREIKRYVANTQADTMAGDSEILIADRPVCVIGKVHNRASYIGMTMSRSGWEPEAGTRLCRTLRREIDDKSGKMEHIELPRILVLFDAFLLALPYVWLDCVRGFPPSSDFHTIFVVTDDQDYVITSAEPRWGELNRAGSYAQLGLCEDDAAH